MWFCKGLFLISLTVLIESNGNYQRNNEHRKLLEAMKSSVNDIVNPKTVLQTDHKLELGAIFAILLLKNAGTLKDDKEIGDSEMNLRTQDNGLPTQNNQNVVIVMFDDDVKTITREGLTLLLSGESELMADISKPNILRDTYTDACVKVAIRKCYQALYYVHKNVCKVRYRCKSKFKSFFKKKSKEGCIKEFDYSQGSVNNKMSYKLKNNKVHSTRFIDATRQGYVDACIPYMVPQYKETRIRNALQNNRAENMLRSRSERRCRKIIREKCVKACHFAVNESCNFYACSKRRWRIFKKVCGEECRRIYPAYRGKKAPDSSDSSSNSDSE